MSSKALSRNYFSRILACQLHENRWQLAKDLSHTYFSFHISVNKRA